MENTQFAFLTSLGGKPTGESGLTGKITSLEGTDEADGKGFFSFLEGLLKTAKPHEEDAFTLLGAQAPLPTNPIKPGEIALTAIEGEQGVSLITPLPLDAAPKANPLLPIRDKVSADAPALSFASTPGSKDVIAELSMGELQVDVPEAKPELNKRTALDGLFGEDGEFPGLNHQLTRQQTKFSAINGALAAAPNVATVEQISGHHALASIHAGVSDSASIDHSSELRLETVSSAAEKSLNINPVRDQIVAAVSARHGDNRLEIRLDPPELGRVLIGFEKDGADIVRAVISADTPDTLDLLRRHADVFQRALEDQGFENLNLQFAEHGAEKQSEQNSTPDAKSFLLADEASLTESMQAGQAISNGRLDRRL